MSNCVTDPNLLDRRLIERNISRGLISRGDYETVCQQGPDLAARCETLAGEPWRAPGEESPAPPPGRGSRRAFAQKTAAAGGS